jgi:hypothetical protein
MPANVRAAAVAALGLLLGCSSGDENASNARPPGFTAPDASGDATSSADGAGAPADAAQEPGCSPATCKSAGAECGTAPDGCGSFMSCGSCPAGLTCGGGGQNRCGTTPCTPKTCAQLGAECGVTTDGCSSTQDCGGCASPNSCGGGGTPNRCGCKALACAQLGAECGFIKDNCGASIDCGSCPNNLPCHVGAPNKCAVPCPAGRGDCDGNATNGCETDLLASAHHCAQCGHDCQAGVCTGGVCGPFELASGFVNPVRIVVDASHVYFTSQGTGGATDGSVSRVPIGGGGVVTLAPSQAAPGSIVASNTALFWVNSGDGTIRSISKSGGSLGTVASGLGNPWGIALSPAFDKVFFTVEGAEQPPSGTVSWVPAAGGGVVQLASGQDHPRAIATDGTYVFWAATGPLDNSSTGRVMRAAMDGSGPVALASAQPHPVWLMIDGAWLYWANFGTDLNAPADGGVWRVPIAGGAPQQLASGQSATTSLASRQGLVYFANANDGSIRSVPAAGGAVKTVVSGQNRPVGITLDSTALYWVNRVGGTVMKVVL